MKNNYESPLKIPEQKMGKFSIRHKLHPKGTILDVVSMRTALYSGCAPTKIQLSKDRTIHQLLEDDGILMSDIPQEIYDHQKPIENAHGDVLVGGLGICYYGSMIAKKKNVKSITIVEKEKDIIDMVQPYIPKRINVIHDDLFEYLKRPNIKSFDYAYYDIWYGTGEYTFKTHVLPLKRLTYKYHGKKEIDCWQEAVMMGQIRQSVFNAYTFQFGELKHTTYDPIIHAFKNHLSFRGGYVNDREIINKYIIHFLTNIGSNDWETTWNWDKILEECKS